MIEICYFGMHSFSNSLVWIMHSWYPSKHKIIQLFCIMKFLCTSELRDSRNRSNICHSFPHHPWSAFPLLKHRIIPYTQDLKEEMPNVAHVLRESSPRSAGSKTESSWQQGMAEQCHLVQCAGTVTERKGPWATYTVIPTDTAPWPTGECASSIL